MDQLPHLRRYLAAALDQDLDPRPVEVQLPLHLGEAYELRRITLFGHSVVLALARHELEDLPPSRLTRDLDTIRGAVETDRVAFVLPYLPSRQRLRLVKAGLPFIVPGRQLYLPMFLVDLREHFPRPTPREGEVLGWAAQLVLLRQLQWGDIEGENLSRVAALTGYTAMTISTVRDELVAANLGEQRVRGRSKTLHFVQDRRALWEAARRRLRSPVKRTWFIERLATAKLGLRAGLTGLSDRTTLSGGEVPTIALDQREFRELHGTGDLVPCPTESEAILFVQAWRYDPLRLALGGSVDPLSLYLSLRDELDERVSLALDELIEALRW